MFASYKKTERTKAAKKTVIKSEEEKDEPAEANLMARRPAPGAPTAPRSQEIAKEDTNKLITEKSTPEIPIETPKTVEAKAPVVQKKGAAKKKKAAASRPQKEKTSSATRTVPDEIGAIKSEKIENHNSALNFARTKEDIQNNIIFADQDYCASSVGISNDAPVSAGFSQCTPGTSPGGPAARLPPLGATEIRLEGASNLSELQPATATTPRDQRGRPTHGAAAPTLSGGSGRRDEPRKASQETAGGHSGRGAPGPAGIDKLSVGQVTLDESILAAYQGGARDGAESPKFNQSNVDAHVRYLRD